MHYANSLLPPRPELSHEYYFNSLLFISYLERKLESTSSPISLTIMHTCNCNAKYIQKFYTLLPRVIIFLLVSYASH
jgi:hypothetical protein